LAGEPDAGVRQGGAIDHGARNTRTGHEDIKIDDDPSLTRMITEATL